MSKLIAMVALAMVVDGVRQVIQPGEPVPELSPHDEIELKKSGSIQDEDETAAAEKNAARAASKAMGDFEREKKAFAAAQASTAVKADPKKK